jgi:hypothetical protein
MSDILHCRATLVTEEKHTEISRLLMSRAVLMHSCSYHIYIYISAVIFSAKGDGVKTILFDTVSDDDEVSVWCTELVGNVAVGLS